MPGGIGDPESEMRLDGAYVSAMIQNARQARLDGAYVSAMVQETKQVVLHGSYVSVMVPVNPRPKRRIVFFSDG